MKINLLDCTLRDGGYYNNWHFSFQLIQDYLNVISKTKIQYVEINFRPVIIGLMPNLESIIPKSPSKVSPSFIATVSF